MNGGWDAIERGIAAARETVRAAAPDPLSAEQGEAYVARVLASQLAGAVLGHLLVEDGFARALPAYGCPNPDYLMRHAGVSSAGRYRVTGRLNGSERVGVGLYRFDATGTAFEVGYAAFDAGNTGPGGTFALDLSAESSGPGTLSIPPEARALLVRILHLDPSAEPARLRLEGPSPPPGLALTTGSSDGALGFVASGLAKTVEQFMEWTRVTSARPNRIEPAPAHLAAAVQGDPDTAYFLGYFNLAEGQALEVTMPMALPAYWSLHAYNHWTEALQTRGANHRNTRADVDGRIRIVIGPGAAGASRIDTLGHSRGILICRIIGGSPTQAPQARLITPKKDT